MSRRNEEQRRQFAEYFAARRDAVRRLAYLLCGDWHLADDLTQIAFMRLATSWSRVRDMAALDGYLRTCLIRAYLSESRRAWRRRERAWSEPPEAAADDEGSAVEARLVVADALRRLPHSQVAALVCRFYLDMDVNARMLAFSVAIIAIMIFVPGGLHQLGMALVSKFKGNRLVRT